MRTDFGRKKVAIPRGGGDWVKGQYFGAPREDASEVTTSHYLVPRAWTRVNACVK